MNTDSDRKGLGMFQNAGEAISYVGYALLLVLGVRIAMVRIRRLRNTGKPPPTFSKSRLLVSVVLLAGGCVLAIIGDHYRISMSKDMVLSYYEQNTPYKDLTDAQVQNIAVATVEMANANRSGTNKAEYAKYRPALEKYLTEEAILHLGYSPKEAAEHTQSLLGK